MENQAIEQRASSPLAAVKSYLANDTVKKRFEEMLGEKAAAFCTSIVNVVGGSKQLQKCNPNSIMAAGMVAASLDLPVEPSLGMAAMVPYGDKASFQIMWRGVVQLCLRTNQYADIQCTEIYRDELRGYNPITGDVVFHPVANFKLRYGDAKVGDVAGYYASFRLVSGFEKKCYMSAPEVMAHAKKYSKAYQYDLKAGKNASAWSTDPVAMGRKTVLLRLLGRWGIKSVQIEKALMSDKQDFETAQQEAAERITAQTGSEVVDTEFEPNGDSASATTGKYKCSHCGAKFDEPSMAEILGVKGPKCPNCTSAKITKKKNAKKTKKKSAKKDETKGIPQFKYRCSSCEAGFDEPKMTGPGENVPTCPNCKSLKVALNPDGETADFMKDD